MAKDAMDGLRTAFRDYWKDPSDETGRRLQAAMALYSGFRDYMRERLEPEAFEACWPPPLRLRG
jgi:hypothetical protein